MSRDLVRACAIGRAATLRRGPGPAGVRADGLFSPAGWDTPTWAQATCGGRVPTCRANACGGRPAATSVSRPASAHGLRKSGQGFESPQLHPSDQAVLLWEGGLSCRGPVEDLPRGIQRLVAHVCLSGRLPRGAIAERPWPDVLAEHTSGSLRSALWRLQQAAPGLVAASGTMLPLAEGVRVDL